MSDSNDDEPHSPVGPHRPRRRVAWANIRIHPEALNGIADAIRENARLTREAAREFNEEPPEEDLEHLLRTLSDKLEYAAWHWARLCEKAQARGVTFPTTPEHIHAAVRRFVSDHADVAAGNYAIVYGTAETLKEMCAASIDILNVSRAMYEYNAGAPMSQPYWGGWPYPDPQTRAASSNGDV
ncbi:hypothetical protein EXIGLDRAFT_700439 [Exidia glandulosa HHB12029]|uniref:Uncharacterized protein n=1 Tax=Exidia glandulosa HHB12029 TaxID=1314781 RepID=A0A165DG14_EXIGL|nr:hypothetical protein EXIGLDRAFT_700439 [Exidia glandulosa HHB12029]